MFNFAIYNLNLNIMKTIAAKVSEYIKTKPYLSTALSQGIINLTSLARKIQPDIENSIKIPATPIASKIAAISGFARNIPKRSVRLGLKVIMVTPP